MVASILFGAADGLQFQGQAIGLSISPPLLLVSAFLLAPPSWGLLVKTNASPSEIAIIFLHRQNQDARRCLR